MVKGQERIAILFLMNIQKFMEAEILENKELNLKLVILEL